MLAYLIAQTVDQGNAYAREMDWTAVARTRFVTAARDDIRLICRASELIPLATVTPMIRSSGYMGPHKDEDAAALWHKETASFDAFVASGRGRWIAPPQPDAA